MGLTPVAWIRGCGLTVIDRRSADGRSPRARQSVGRVGGPDEIAAAVAFLASPHADFITGVNLLVEDGK